MGLFKNGDELYDQGIDLIGRKDFNDARGKLQKALEKGCKNEAHARFCIAMINLSGNLGNTGAYEGLKQAMTSMSGPVKFGVVTADASKIVAQADVTIEEISASSMPDSDFMAKGQAYIAVAGKFSAEFGDENLPIQEMVKGTSVTGNKEALVLQAEAYEIMGKGAVYANPKQGSEYLQMAYNFRKQIGDSGEEDLQLMKNFSVTAKCWLCGKQVSGRGVHFMAVGAEISDMFRGKESAEAIRSTSEDFGSIYMCMPCYSAISHRVNEITEPRFISIENQMAAMQAEIVSLQSQISTLRFASR